MGLWNYDVRHLKPIQMYDTLESFRSRPSGFMTKILDDDERVLGALAV